VGAFAAGVCVIVFAWRTSTARSLRSLAARLRALVSLGGDLILRRRCSALGFTFLELLSPAVGARLRAASYSLVARFSWFFSAPPPSSTSPPRP